jgi:hypothetical protein
MRVSSVKEALMAEDENVMEVLVRMPLVDNDGEIGINHQGVTVIPSVKGYGEGYVKTLQEANDLADEEVLITIMRVAKEFLDHFIEHNHAGVRVEE